MSVDQITQILHEGRPISPPISYRTQMLLSSILRRSRSSGPAGGRKSGNAEIDRWSDAALLENAELTVDREPTYAGLILLGTGKAVSRHLAQAEAIFEYRNSEASIPYQQRQEFRRGFFTWFDEIWALINLRNDVQQFREGLFKYDIATFDEDSVREAVLNAVSHRDYRDGGSIWIRQFPRMLEIEKSGRVPGRHNARECPRSPEAAQPAYRRSARQMRTGRALGPGHEPDVPPEHPAGQATSRLSGVRKHSASDPLAGEIGDPRFLRFLEQIGDEQLKRFSTDDFLAIDLIHRDQPLIDRLKERAKRLLDAGVVERSGRGKFILSRKFYAFPW